MNELDLCREEGFRQFIKSGGRNVVNPYLSGTEEYQQFTAGWRQAAFICGLDVGAVAAAPEAPAQS